MAKLPSLDDFLKDPKHEESRTFLSGLIRAEVTKMAEERKGKKNAPKSEKNLFDQIFGGEEDDDE